VRKYDHVAQWQQWQIQWSSRQMGMTRHEKSLSLPVKYESVVQVFNPNPIIK
jgi:hypothetical protein